jgi:serine/threonine-protein kinase RsbT
VSPASPHPGAPAPDLTGEILSVLTRYMSASTASSVLKLSRERAGNAALRLDRGQLQLLLAPIERNLRLFLPDPRKAEDCRRQLDTLTRDPKEAKPAGPLVIAVRVEDDIVRARNEGRNLAAEMGYSPTGQTRLATAVSELARNIVQYAGAGQIQFTPTSVPGIEVVAKDRGPGIPNLEQIFNGTYKSRLGMGLGLRGVKKLGERFDVQTAAGKGTTVSFHLRVM